MTKTLLNGQDLLKHIEKRLQIDFPFMYIEKIDDRIQTHRIKGFPKDYLPEIRHIVKEAGGTKLRNGHRSYDFGILYFKIRGKF